MSASLSATIPQPTAPMVDANGLPTRVWWYWFQKIQTRTGGSSGGSYGPPQAIRLTGSPFIFTAPANGSLILAGGGVNKLQFSQDGSTWFPAGNFYAALPLGVGGMAEITYVRAPIATFLPGG